MFMDFQSVYVPSFQRLLQHCQANAKLSGQGLAGCAPNAASYSPRQAFATPLSLRNCKSVSYVTQAPSSTRRHQKCTGGQGVSGQGSCAYELPLSCYASCAPMHLQRPTMDVHYGAMQLLYLIGVRLEGDRLVQQAACSTEVPA